MVYTIHHKYLHVYCNFHLYLKNHNYILGKLISSLIYPNRKMVRLEGLEPPTFRVEAEFSNPLRYSRVYSIYKNETCYIIPFTIGALSILCMLDNLNSGCFNCADTNRTRLCKTRISIPIPTTYKYFICAFQFFKFYYCMNFCMQIYSVFISSQSSMNGLKRMSFNIRIFTYA